MYLKINQLNIHYTISGKGHPIVLLHGWGNNALSFAEVHKHLAKNFTVYDIDLPGFGLSTQPSEAWDTKDYANLVAKFLEMSKIKRPILLGHSLGGRIAIRLASEYSLKLYKLILVDSAGIRPQHGFTWYRKVYTYKLLKKLANLAFLRYIFKSKIESYKKRAGSSDYRKASGVMRNTLVKIVNEDLRHLLPQIKTSALLIWGENDTETPVSNGKLMAKLISNSKLIVIPNAGHHPHHDQFKNFINFLNTFLL